MLFAHRRDMRDSIAVFFVTHSSTSLIPGPGSVQL